MSTFNKLVVVGAFLLVLLGATQYAASLRKEEGVTVLVKNPACEVADIRVDAAGFCKISGTVTYDMDGHTWIETADRPGRRIKVDSWASMTTAKGR